MSSDYNCKFKSDPMTFYEYHPLTPEKRMIAGILELAARDYRGPNQVDARDASSYILSTSNTEWSFNWACQMLDLDPITLRKAILESPEPLFTGTLGCAVYVRPRESKYCRRSA